MNISRIGLVKALGSGDLNVALIKDLIAIAGSVWVVAIITTHHKMMGWPS